MSHYANHPAAGPAECPVKCLHAEQVSCHSVQGCEGGRRQHEQKAAAAHPAAQPAQPLGRLCTVLMLWHAAVSVHTVDAKAAVRAVQLMDGTLASSTSLWCGAAACTEIYVSNGMLPSSQSCNSSVLRSVFTERDPCAVHPENLQPCL